MNSTHRLYPTRRESDTAIANPGANQAVSGVYPNTSESDVVDENRGLVSQDHGDDYPMDEDYEDEEDRLIAQGGMGIPLDEVRTRQIRAVHKKDVVLTQMQHGQPSPLLPVMDRVHVGRKCLVLDLDETLLHSSFKVSYLRLWSINFCLQV